MLITSAEFVTSAALPGQWPPPELPEFAFAGRSNVGKSSLLNTLMNRRRLALTSATPGKTRLLNFFRVNRRYLLVDLPGYGYARVSESERRSWRPMVEGYLAGRRTLRAVAVLIDIRRTPGPEEDLLLHWLARRGLPALVVATKADKVSRSSQATRRALIAESLGLSPEAVILFSAKTRLGRQELWNALAGYAAPEDERA
ncbi:MAG: ribosome biogenesis GTP-binding protein YihA/YsxC [Desulfobacterales bacterium]